MNTEERGDPRNAVVREILAEIDRDIPEPDWVRLRTSIVRRGRPVLARKARLAQHPWLAKATPLATAAGIALVLWFVPQVGPDGVFAAGADSVRDEQLLDETQVIEALEEDISEAEFRLLVSGRANPEAMLAVAVSE